MPKKPNKVNLASLFQVVAGSLADQKETLNNADTYNHDHGNNMVETFTVISQAMQAKRNATPADQLAYASQLLRERQSGSAQLYAQGLSQASKEFQGQKKVTPDNSIKLIQALLGGGQAPAAPDQAGMGDLLGTLLGGGNANTQQSQGGTGEMLGMLLGGSGAPQGQSQSQQSSPGVDMGDLLNAGMAFMNTKSQGGNNAQALVNALVSASAMGNSGHRSQSGAVVVNSLLQAISNMSGKK